MIHRIIPAALAFAAALATAACGDDATGNAVNATSTNATGNATAAAPKIELPPAIKASKTYRCRDNSLFYANFLADDVTANVRDKEEEPPAVTLKAPAPGQPFEGEGETGRGFKLSGSGDTVTYTSPDSGTQSCRSRAAATS